jgi:electron transfer flavoprotein beta subunit
MNPYDTNALEEALRLKDRFGFRVVALSMGPPNAEATLRKALALGADDVVLISDRVFGGADTLATSNAITEAIRRLGKDEEIAFILCGKQTIDGDTAQVGPGVATRLEMPLVTYSTHIESFDPDTRTAVVHRLTERGIEVLQTRLPALLTVEKEITPIKRAPLANMIKAVSYQPEVWTASEPVPFDPEQIGIKGSPTIVGRAYTPAPRQAGGMVRIAEIGAEACARQALEQIGASGVVDIAGIAGASRQSSGNGGAH